MKDNDLLASIKELDNPKEDGLLASIKDIENERTSALRANIFASTPIPPEKATQQYQMSRATGIPIETVRAKENEIKQRTELDSINYDDLVNNFPKVAMQLADASKAGAIRDDISNLSYFEKITGSVKQEYKGSQENVAQANLLIKQMFSDVSGNEKYKLSPIEENNLALISESQSQRKDYGLGFVSNIPSYTAAAIPTILDTIPATLGGTAVGAGLGFATAGAPGAVIGAKLGSKAGTALSVGRLETGLAYQELRGLVDINGKPIEKSVAAGGAIATGVVNGLLELIPFGEASGQVKKAFSREGVKQLAKTEIGKEYLKNVGRLAISEGAAEGLQELSNIVFSEAAKAISTGDFQHLGMKNANDSEGLVKFLSDSANRIWESFKAGAGAGLGLGIATGGISAAQQIRNKKGQDTQDQQTIRDVVDNAKQSKILKRDPELFKEVTKDTLGEQSIYLPAEQVQTYFQNKTPQEQQVIHTALPAISEQLQEALDTGGNIVLKGNDVAAALVTHPELSGLQEFMKLSPESFSDLEAQDSFLQNVIPSVHYEEQQKKGFSEQDVVRKNIEKQILNLGMPYRDAKDLISTAQSYYDTVRSRAGNEEAQKVLDTYLGSLEAKNAPYKETPFKAINKIENLDLFLDKARKPIKEPKVGKPLLKMLKEHGGVQLGSNLAGELGALGISPKTMVGLFKKEGGIGDIDNIPETEFRAQFPNIAPEIEGDYVARQYLLDRLANEVSGQDISQTANPEQDQVKSFLEELDRAGIDINGSNEEIKKAIKEFEGQTFNQAAIAIDKKGKLDFKGQSKVSTSEVFANKADTSISQERTKEADKLIPENKFEQLPKTQVRISGIIPTQKFISKDNLQKVIKATTDTGAFLLKDGDKYYVLDGHHRIAANIIKGENIITAHVFDKNDQTQTEAFKKWFGDSKVVDENGKPLVVYHGTPTGGFAEFNKFPAYFSPDKEIATIYESASASSIRSSKVTTSPETKAVYLSLKNPFDTRIPEHRKIFEKEFDRKGGEDWTSNGTPLSDRSLPDWTDGEDLAAFIKEKNLPYDGILVDEGQLGGYGQALKDRGISYIAFEPTQIKSAIGNQGTFDPESGNIYNQGEEAPRGQTRFLGQKPIITLFEGKNKSTVLHELGHVFLQINKDIAAVPNVSEQIKEDWKTLENWLGIKDGNITTEAHEKFARGFESYLREGKAPSIALRDAFRRFKTWLIRIYKDASELNVKLTNEVRDVFDRMLATDEAIDSLKNNPIFRSDDQISELLTAAEKKDYQKLNDTANEKAKEKLLTKALKQKEIENKKFYKEERKRVKSEVEDEMSKDKTFRVIHFLKTGQLLGEAPIEGAKGYKLSREDIKNNYDTEFLKYLPADILAKDGAPVDLVAEEFGFNDAGQMLYSIANVPNFKEELKKATDAEMVRRYGDMLYDGTIENEALDASENEARANKILYELNATNRKVKTYVETKEAYKQKAKEIIATKQIKDATDTNTFYLNEVKAAREAGKALGQKDYEKAVDWKKKQLLNHYLFRESLAIKNEVQKALKSYARIKKTPKAGKVTIDEDFRLKAVNLLQDFNLAPKSEDYQKTNVADLETWKQEQTDSGVLGLVEFPELAQFQDKDNIRSLTTDQFRTLDDAIQNLVTVGRNANILEVNGKKQELNSIVDRIIEQANTNIKKDYLEIEDPTEREKLVKAFDSFASSLIKTSQTTLKIDGEKNLGEFYQLFEKDLNKAELSKNKMADESYKKLDAIYNKHFGGYKISDKRIYFDSVSKSYSKKAVLAFALNWGNEINRTRVRDGFNYSDAQVIDIISSLNKNELEFVQDIWNLINEYWPAIESTEKKLFGIAPKKQNSVPLKIISKDGQEVSLKGGYYPLSYTAEANFKSDTAEDLKETLFGTGFDKVNFHKSFTKERTEQKVSKKITLDLNPLSKHLTQVITDIAVKPAAWNAYRIINNRRLKTALVKKIGIADYKQLQSWVYDMYGRTITQEGFIGKAANLSRDVAVTWTMGFKLSTAIIQPTGLLQSIVKIGYKNMGLGIWKALGNGNPISINQSAKLAFAKSKILEDRSKTMTRDIYEVIDRLQKTGKLRKNITKFAFLATTKMQMLADLPTWYGAYYKGLKDFNGNDAKAVELADRLLIETQGSSYKQSLSALQRDDSALVKAFTIFGNYANVKLNLLAGSYRGTDFKKPKDTAKFISDFALLFAADAILTEFLREGISNLISGRSNEGDDEDKSLHYANLVAGSLTSPIPVVNQIYSGLNYGRESYYPSGFKGVSIVGGGISKLGKQAVDAVSEDEEVDLIKVLQGLNETSAIFTMGGGAQIDIFLKALKEENEGNEPAPIDYVLKPPRK